MNIEEDNDGPLEQESVVGNSSYLKAFCYCLEEILDEYRGDIIKIEK